MTQALSARHTAFAQWCGKRLGLLTPRARRFSNSFFSFAAKQLGREFSSYCGRAWARVSCTLQRSVSQAILTRIDGRELPRVAPSGPDNFVTIPESPAKLVSAPAPSTSLRFSLALSAAAPAAVLALPFTPEPSAQLESTSLLPASRPSPTAPATKSLAPSTPAPVTAPVFSLAPWVPFQPSAVGGVVAVRADGDCCYHLCGLVGDLMLNPATVQCGHHLFACSDLCSTGSDHGQHQRVHRLHQVYLR